MIKSDSITKAEIRSDIHTERSNYLLILKCVRLMPVKLSAPKPPGAGSQRLLPISLRIMQNDSRGFQTKNSCPFLAMNMFVPCSYSVCQFLKTKLKAWYLKLVHTSIFELSPDIDNT